MDDLIGARRDFVAQERPAQLTLIYEWRSGLSHRYGIYTYRRVASEKEVLELTDRSRPLVVR